MEANKFSINQQEYRKIVEKINKLLAVSLNVDMTEYISICRTENEPVAKAIKIEYEDKGWDIKLNDDLDYNNMSDEIEILIRLGRE